MKQQERVKQTDVVRVIGLSFSKESVFLRNIALPSKVGAQLRRNV